MGGGEGANASSFCTAFAQNTSMRLKVRSLAWHEIIERENFSLFHLIAFSEIQKLNTFLEISSDIFDEN